MKLIEKNIFTKYLVINDGWTYHLPSWTRYRESILPIRQELIGIDWVVEVVIAGCWREYMEKHW